MCFPLRTSVMVPRIKRLNGKDPTVTIIVTLMRTKWRSQVQKSCELKIILGKSVDFERHPGTK